MQKAFTGTSSDLSPSPQPPPPQTIKEHWIKTVFRDEITCMYCRSLVTIVCSEIA
ncbi:hypothetical protein F2Q68_00014297 [Brassica cretica]|uniref:BED-type domain-containing protein n=2 Tax=Brassica cretica TaxID=69181 RepID=A0ABQ7EPN4_BRACR|nr:hypothetical protein F2Q68_00014297 [Brassica cretica]KAF3605355.1 hypothetical protein DY000_02046775 [Brassica cretica]